MPSFYTFLKNIACCHSRADGNPGKLKNKLDSLLQGNDKKNNS